MLWPRGQAPVPLANSVGPPTGLHQLEAPPRDATYRLVIAAVRLLACQPVAVRIHPVIEDAATVVSAVAESVGHPLSLHSELDVDVYRLRATDDRPDGPDLVARVFGPDVERATVGTAAHVLQKLAGTRFPAERCPTADPVLALAGDRHLLVTEYV